MPTIVNDNGTGYVKCGYAGEDIPSFMFPAMIGRPILRADQGAAGDIKDIMVGEECMKHRASLDITYPIRNGIVRNWEDMEILWDYTWRKLDIEPGECNIMLTEAPMNPKKNRQKTFEYMFEKYGFQSAYCAIQATLVLYSRGVLTGCVVDAGDGVTHVIPIYEGQYAPQLSTAPNVKRLDLAGHALTENLLSLLHHRGYSFNKDADFDTVRQIKERFCYVAVDFELEKKLALETTVLEKSYVLPDMRKLKIGSERFEAPEALFRPELMGIESRSGGLGQMTFDAINSSARDVQSDLFKNVVLSGGTTMLPGLTTRLENELKERYTQHKLGGAKRNLTSRIRIDDPPNKRNVVFAGASVLASLMQSMPEQWISKQEWEENGAKAMEKCM